MSTCHRCGAARAEQARFCAACGAAIGQGGETPAVRKHVVIFFVDIVGSTALGERLDPESLRRYLKRYFDTVSAVLWRHGGTVEKFIGDAVMAVFGVPLAREDDAVRALRAAAELLREVAGISAALEREYGSSLQVRIGVNGGEVFVSRHAGGDYSVTGDAVNTAARLEQHAGPSETFVGGTVAHLAGPSAGLTPAAPLHAKGKAQPLPVWRLDPAVLDGFRSGRRIRTGTVLVGRDDELADLHRVADRVTARQESCLVTVLGSAGIGKSRLVDEFLGGRDGARVFEGHCPSYPSGSTFWPLAQVLEQLGADWTDQVALFLGAGQETDLVVERLATAVGRSADDTSLDDIVWAARRLVEALAKDRPLVLVWDDLHWAEPTFLEFLTRLTARLRWAPVLMICLSRPELLELHPNWGGGRGWAVSMELAPLPPECVRELVDELTAGVVAHGAPALAATTEQTGSLDLDRLLRVSEGNPLIVQQMVQFTATGAELPVTIQTLFEARLDRLHPADRLFCECAAVIGREFWAEAVRLVAEQAATAGPATTAEAARYTTLDRLVRLDVVQPTRARSAGRPGHRFTHALLMETVYRATTKSQRSRWHGRVAAWVAAAAELADGERSELAAFHLERAHALLVEISRDDPDAAALAERAAEAAMTASEHGLARSDLPVAARMLRQAQRLLPAGDRRHHDVARRMVDCLVAAGSLGAAAEALDRADAALAGDPLWTVLGRVARADLDLRRDPGGRDSARRTATEAITVLASGAVAGPTAEPEPGALLWAYELLALSHTVDLHLSPAAAAMNTALGYARAAGDRRAERRLLCGLCEMAFWGPTPVAEAREMCWALLPLIENDLRVTAPVLAMLAGLAAMEGDAGAASALMDRARHISDDLRLPGLTAGLRQFSGLVAAWTGDPGAAEEEFSAGAAEMARQDSAAAATLRVMAARAALEAGRVDRTGELMGWVGGVTGPPTDSDDAHYRALWWGLAARFSTEPADAGPESVKRESVKREAVERAVGWADRAVAAAASAENPRGHGDALLDLAVVRRRAGDGAGADEALAAAVRRYLDKGARRCAEVAAMAGGSATGDGGVGA